MDEVQPQNNSSEPTPGQLPQNPIKKSKKNLWIVLSIIFLIIIVIVVRLVFLFKSFAYDAKKQDLIDIVEQKETIVQSIQTSENERLSSLAKTQVEQYMNEKKVSCKNQYIVKTDCKLEDFNIDNLTKLNLLLENQIQEIVRVQSL